MNDSRLFAPTWTTRWRSTLFVPGDDDRKLAKATAGQADAVIIDLEDGVGTAAKPAARLNVVPWAARLKTSGRDVVVRINAGWRDAIADMGAIQGAAIDAVMVPKVEDRARISIIADMLNEFEIGPVAIIALIESPYAFVALQEIAGFPRVIGLAFGSEDYAKTLDVEPTPGCLDLPCRLLAMAGAGRMVLATPLSIAQFRDETALRTAYADARQMGISGALCIHPTQVELANRTFVPLARERADAQNALEAWDKGQARGEAVVSFGGRMIDKPVAARLRRLCETSDHAESTLDRI